jgi:NhaC family Na+:H+ antiporter
MSPLSDIPNLATVISGSNLFDHIKHMMWSAAPAWLAGMAIYVVAGLKYGDAAVRSETLDLILRTLKANFRFSPLLLLPMAVIFYFAVAKKPTIPAMILSSLVAAALAVLVQKIPLTDVATAMNAGLPARTGVEVVDTLLAKGGMMSMMETQLIAFTAFAYGGIMQATGCLAVILDRVMKFTRHVWSLVLTTVGAAVLSAMITGSSYLSMILPADLLAPAFKKKDLAAKNLSRIIEESGGIIVPLIPWSMAGVYITGTLGVSTFSYLPWAFMNYLSVGILVLFGFTGWTMSPRVRDDETQAGS